MIYIALFIISLSLTYIIRGYANKKEILDIPNERSSHLLSTPRGGGLAIIISFYIGVWYFIDTINTPLFYALLSAIPIIIISLLDDIFTISAKIRFLTQSLSALIALYFLGGVNYIDLIIFELNGWWVNILVFLSIIWITNLYNFLDGIDGYAGSQAVIIGLGFFLFFNNPLGLVIVAISLGFLVFNWHKASIFMGDVGSASLGFIFAILIFSNTTNGNIYISLILLSIFWIDATVTLFRRYRNREKITKAHNKHAYQRLIQLGWTHSEVTLSAITLNLFFLLLLYFLGNPLMIFLLNTVIIYLIILLIDKKKKF